MSTEEKKLKEKLADYQAQMLEKQKLFDEKRKEHEQMRVMYNKMEQEMNTYKQNAPNVPASQNIVVHTAIGHMPEFDVKDDWRIYQARLEQYIIVNSVSENLKVSTLITFIGNDAYKILSDLCDPTEPKNKTFEELCAILKSQFSKKVSAFKERLEYNNLVQGKHESVTDWYGRVKSKAVSCGFGNLLNDFEKDRVVTGLCKGPLLDRVCEEEPTATLDTIIDIARKKEATILFSRNNQNNQSVHKVQTTQGENYNRKNNNGKKSFNNNNKQNNNNNSKGNKNASNKNNNVPVCKRCGGTKHNFSKCKYKEYTCKGYKNKGHLIKVCPKAKNDSNNYVDFSSRDENLDIGLQYVDMYCMSSESEVDKPIILKILVNDIPIEVELDSGSGRSIMLMNIYKKYLSTVKIDNTLVRLKLYDGTIMVPEGEIKVTTKYGEIKEELVSDRYLTHYDPTLPIKLVCDASNVGIGGVLLHVFPDGSERPISFASRVLQPAEKSMLLYKKKH